MECIENVSNTHASVKPSPAATPWSKLYQLYFYANEMDRLSYLLFSGYESFQNSKLNNDLQWLLNTTDVSLGWLLFFRVILMNRSCRINLDYFHNIGFLIIEGFTGLDKFCIRSISKGCELISVCHNVCLDDWSWWSSWEFYKYCGYMLSDLVNVSDDMTNHDNGGVYELMTESNQCHEVLLRRLPPTWTHFFQDVMKRAAPINAKMHNFVENIFGDDHPCEIEKINFRWDLYIAGAVFGFIPLIVPIKDLTNSWLRYTLEVFYRLLEY